MPNLRIVSPLGTFAAMIPQFSLHTLRFALLATTVLSMGCSVPVHEVPKSQDVTWNNAAWARGIRWYGAGEEPAAAALSNPRTGEVWAVVFRDSADLQPLGDAPHVVIGDAAAHGLATLSTTHVALMSAWNPNLSHWAGGAYVDYLQDDQALQRLAAGLAQDFSGQPELDRERLLAAQPAALTIYPFGDPLAGSSIADRIPVLPLGEYLEPHPLGRAEWMVLLGWACGEWSEARAVFDQIVERYVSVRDSVAGVAIAPKVFAGSVRNGVWHAPGGESLVAQFLHDAGANYMFNARDGHENVEVPLEEMLAMASQSDAWGVVWHEPAGLDWSAVIDADARYADLVPNTGKIFGANTAECDYFGSWVARPDDMLRNLANLFHPDWVSPVEEPCFVWLDGVPNPSRP